MRKSIGKVVPECYLSYGMYVNTEKMIPFSIDGLLPVYRRVLLAIHTLARKNYVKTANAIGLVAGQWHPHEVGVGPFVWAVQNGFAVGDGQWGFNVGKCPIDAAAARYTKVKSEDLIEEMAFKYIDYVKWVVGELDHKEPVFLPTAFPFCLMAKKETQRIGFGIKAQIPCYPVESLVARLLNLLKKGPKTIIYPNTPGCKITSDDSVLEELATTGIAKVSIQGECKVDHKNLCVHIYGWSPRVKYESIENRINNYKKWNLISNGDIGSNDDSTDHTDIRFEVLRRNGKQEIFKKMVEAIKASLKSSLAYKLIVVDPNNEVKVSSVDEMLLNTYTCYEKAFEQYLKHSINKIQEEIDDLDIVFKIRDHISKALSMYKNNTDKVYTYLSSKTKVPIDAVKKVCGKYRINRLMSVTTDTTELKKEKLVFENQLKYLSRETVKQYKNFLR